MFLITRSISMLAFGLFLASSAVAAQHTYPGAMCEKTNATAGNRGTPKVDNSAQLLNSSVANDLTVVCPVVGPFNDLSGAAPDNKAEVFVHDIHLDKDICCSARLNNTGVVRFGPQVCSSGTDTRSQTLVMTTPIFNFSFTSRYFLCTIPETFLDNPSSIRLYRY